MGTCGDVCVDMHIGICAGELAEEIVAEHAAAQAPPPGMCANMGTDMCVDMRIDYFWTGHVLVDAQTCRHGRVLLIRLPPMGKDPRHPNGTTYDPGRTPVHKKGQRIGL